MAISNLRLSGINSGYDTEAMIEQMLTGYQSKIDIQNKKLTKLTWQQNAYRDIISKFTTFKSKYFDILKKDSYLLSPSTFSRFNSTISGKTLGKDARGIGVVTSTNSAEGNYKIRVSQLATATKAKGSVITPANFKLDLAKAAEHSSYTENEDGTRNYNFSLDVKVGDVSRTVEFSAENIALDEDGNIDMQAFSDAVTESLNTALQDAFGRTGADKDDSDGIDDYFVQVKSNDDGTLSFEVNGNATVSIAEKDGVFGLAKASKVISISGMSAVTGTNTVAVTIGGITKNVSFEGVSDTYFDSRNESGNEEILAEYNELKEAAFRKENNLLWFIPVSKEALDSYNYSSAQAAKDKNNAALESALNEAFSGVSSKYFDDKDESGNEKLLEEYNALKEAAFRKENNLSDEDEIDPDEFEAFEYTNAQAVKDKNLAEFGSALNVEFGISDKGYVTAIKNGVAQEFSMTSVEGGTLGLEKGSVSNKMTSRTTLRDLGITGNDITIDGSTGEVIRNYSFEINGKKIDLDENATIDDLINAVNNSGAGVTMSFSTITNNFEIKANDMGSSGKIEFGLNAEGEPNRILKELGLLDSEVTVGQNAVFTINGSEIYHNSNSYTLDGTTFNFDDDITIDEDYEINITKSYDDLKQTIKDFVNDYNQLVDDIYNYIGTAPARDKKNNLYEPLTDAEKEGMSEKEIEKWEETAKQGVLYQDSTVSSIMSQLRTALYNSVTLDDGSKFGLFNMGIKTVSYLDSSSEDVMRGKLTIDEDALDAAFANNVDAIQKLFTDTETGVMAKVNNIIDNAVRSTGTSKGTLINKAGLASGSTAKDNYIYRQMQSIQSRIATLQKRYDAKEEYWWKVFTNLEKVMADLNDQSAYMSSYLAGFGNNNSGYQS
ncbi:MAG: flagellar filament capping protein FliD [Oscillospiraceae bacterium]|nr:flagellar filament capping protein FliD [Oscillospiraceae bacterium]